MLYRFRRKGGDRTTDVKGGDPLASLALPLAVLLLGVALSIGATGGFDAFIGLCTSVIGR